MNNLKTSYQKDIPDPSYTNIGKLGSGGDLTSDRCNEERKTHRIIVEQFHEAEEALHKGNSDEILVLEVDCWNHLRNMWLRRMKNSLSSLISNTMREELDEIYLRLRVSTSIKSVPHVVDKEFILYTNYPKGHRELFRKTCSIPRCLVRSHSLVCSENPFSIVGIGPIPVKEL